ncbi:hypothetical protein [Flavobacterium sp.]|jgi:hypothetical protein|uniref:hypothetical protein n=1 Tax=Flavobacterium sp. TaxID=239 RepID=UPI0037C0AC92
MGSPAILSIKIIADGKQAGREFRETNQQVAAFDDGLRKASIGSAVAIAGIGALALASGQAASALQQSTGAVESVFATHATEVEKLAKDAANNLGLAQSEYQQMAAVLGSQLKNMGTPMDALAGQTDDLMTMGADLAATFGGTTSDAVAALSSLLRGERDPIERYGVSLKQADIDARLAQMGLSGLEGQAKKNAEAQATLALLTEQTASAQGQFARESDTAAGAQQRATATWNDALATLGEGLLPVMVFFADALKGVAGWVKENTGVAIVLMAVIGGLAGGILLLNGAITAYRTIAAIATAAQIAWNVAMSMNPIGLIILGIAALVAAIIWVVANWDMVSKAVTDFAQGAIAWIMEIIHWLGLDKYINLIISAFQNMGRIAGNVWDGIVSGIKGVIGWVQDAIGWLGSLFGAEQKTSTRRGTGGYPGTGGWGLSPALGIAGLTSYDGEVTGASGGWPSWAAFPSSSSSMGIAPVTYNFTINGAIDTNETALQIKEIVENYDRRQGRA